MGLLSLELMDPRVATLFRRAFEVQISAPKETPRVAGWEWHPIGGDYFV